MTRKAIVLISMAAMLTITGCIKETYNIDSLSKKAHLSPTLAIAAVRGDISISDLKNLPNDTVIFDADNFIRFVFRQDSVLDYSIDDYADFDNLAEFHLNEVYPVSGSIVINIKDTVDFEPGNDIQIEKIVIKTGVVNYSVRSASLVSAAVTIKLPTVLTGGVSPVTKNITVPANSTVTGSFSIDNTVVDLSKDPAIRYNRLPVEYSITPISGNFGLLDKMFVQIDMPSPGFDYAKGYFGQQTEIDQDTIDLEIEEILNHISGEFLLSNPSITLNYKNSFAIPTSIDIKAIGYRNTETVPLGLNPFPLSYPAAPSEKDKIAVFTVDKSNSDLPDLVSMPPQKISFSSSAKMNPDGNDGSRNNYIFSDSRFIGNLEIEVPMEFSINNLQFTDTTDNFLKMEDSSDSPVNTEDFEFLRIDFKAENGFPLGISLSMILYDTLTSHNIDTVSAATFLDPADVDATGKVTHPKSCSTSIEIDRKFWSSIDIANRIIFSFKLNTTDGGTKNVKIYSDYRIDFKASLVLKPDIKFNFK
jgi:hypothetical protein